MYSPPYSTGMYTPNMYLQQVASSLVQGTPSTTASSPLLPGFYAPFPVPPLSGTASPTLFGGAESLENIPLVMVENTPAQLRKLFIGGLNHGTDDDELKEYYSRFGVVVDSIVIKEQNTKISRGFGFVTFATMEMADRAMDARPHIITGKQVDTKRAIARDQMLQLQNSIHPPTFLIIDPAAGCKLAINAQHSSLFNGSSETDCENHTIDQLRTYFERYGPVEQVEIVGHPRGSGFVVFENRQDAQNCLANGPFHLLEGSFVEVREFSEIYGYNVHYGNGALQYYNPRGNPHVHHTNASHYHHRQPQRQLASVNSSPESTSASETGHHSPQSDNNAITNAVAPALNEVDEFPPLSPSSTKLPTEKTNKVLPTAAAVVAGIPKNNKEHVAAKAEQKSAVAKASIGTTPSNGSAAVTQNNSQKSKKKRNSGAGSANHRSAPINK